MKQLDDTWLTPNQRRALSELKCRLFDQFGAETVILYGSAARGAGDRESDQDLLIVTPTPLARPARHNITDMVFEVNLRYDTNFSTLVVDRLSWESGPVSVLPLHDEILRDGIVL
jgi:predicted nucleotidyltransferase